MDMALETARSEMEEEGIGRIRFFPDGASTGGNVELSLGEVVWRIEINWLTGEVVVIEPKDRNR